MAKQILSEEFRRMQKLAGIITEDQYMNEGAGIEQFEDYVSDMFNMAIPEDAEEGEYFEDVWEKSEYGDEEEYDTEEWYGLTDYLKSVGGKATLEGNPDINLELMRNGDIKFGATVTLDESLNEGIKLDILMKNGKPNDDILVVPNKFYKDEAELTAASLRAKALKKEEGRKDMMVFSSVGGARGDQQFPIEGDEVQDLILFDDAKKKLR
jgi:hypothetical protein